MPAIRLRSRAWTHASPSSTGAGRTVVGSEPDVSYSRPTRGWRGRLRVRLEVSRGIGRSFPLLPAPLSQLESRVDGDQPENQQDYEDGNHVACLVEDPHEPARASAIARRQPPLRHCKSHTTAGSRPVESITTWKQRARGRCTRGGGLAPRAPYLWCTSTVRWANRHIPAGVPVTGAIRRPPRHRGARAGTARPASCR